MLRKWVENWKKADRALRLIKLRELREYDYSEHLDTVDALMEIGARSTAVRTNSGLVTQQKLFSRLRP